jgi:hypothetical protein
MKTPKHLEEIVGPRVEDGLYGPRTKFGIEVWHMDKKQAKEEACKQHGLRLDAEAEIARLRRKVKKLKQKLKDKDFCNECQGPYRNSEWLMRQYGGHWDTCPNRPKT